MIVGKPLLFIGEYCNKVDKPEMVTALGQIKKHHFSLVSSGNYPTRYPEMTASEKAAFVMASKSAGYRYAITKTSLPATVRNDQPIRVTTTWRNMGSAPTYDDWNVMLQLKNPSGKVVGQYQLSDRLRTVLPGEKSNSTTLTPKELPTGKLTASLVVLDPRKYLAPMGLSNTVEPATAAIH